ncbi:crotonase/enoyl-CoA hydratase family protein [Streptomyces sp. NPDC052013]|uniref:crotonase/enoyl-CoA hydratase family protein n=1 Tax=Streptomyces sp. NPDC052013 TaxID=3365679 RepID=UPI0037D4F7AB
MPVRSERRGPVTTVVLSRPEVRNAVDGPTAAELADAFRAFEADDEARVAVLWGEGGTFCAGADLKALGTERGNRVAEDGDGPMGPTRMRLSKPVIAAVAGQARRGGRAGTGALVRSARRRGGRRVRGVLPPLGRPADRRRHGPPPRLIGTSRALDLILTGRPVPAPEAYEMGLANRVVPTGRARDAAEELAAGIARFPQHCLRSDRASVLDQEGLDEPAALRGELRHGTAVLAESHKGAARFASGAGRHGSFSDV